MAPQPIAAWLGPVGMPGVTAWYGLNKIIAPKAGETIVQHGVTIIGAINVASGVPYHASQMYARNITSFLTHLIKEQKLELNMDDEIVRDEIGGR